jgi:sporadic carbohydrate cluster protein (TIGR04323 family)
MNCRAVFMSEPAHGYRGYIGSRPILGQRTAQHVQNLVVRDYAQRLGLPFKLSASEYAMPGCYMILRQLLDELPSLDGIIAYSLFMLPQARERRRTVVAEILNQGKILHFALEAMPIAKPEDAQRLEDIWLVQLATSPADRREVQHGPD